MLAPTFMHGEAALAGSPLAVPAHAIGAAASVDLAVLAAAHDCARYAPAWAALLRRKPALAVRAACATQTARHSAGAHLCAFRHAAPFLLCVPGPCRFQALSIALLGCWT